MIASLSRSIAAPIPGSAPDPGPGPRLMPPASAPRPRLVNSEPPQRRPAGKPAVAFGQIADGTGHRVVFYGPGGIGKTTLACTAPGPVAFFDLDDSLPRLKVSLSESGLNLDVRPVTNANTWQDVRDALCSDGWSGIRSIVIDSATRAEELAAAHTLATVPHEKKEMVIRRIEDYGFGKGYQHVYETFLAVLGDLDQHTRAGRNVILICHDCTASVPNPSGDDWLRYEPRLQSPSSGKASIRLRVREWADHLLFVGYDLDVRDGKGKGSGTRTIYPCELPHCMAKSRTLSDTLALDKFDTTLWNHLMGDHHASQS